MMLLSRRAHPIDKEITSDDRNVLRRMLVFEGHPMNARILYSEQIRNLPWYHVCALRAIAQTRINSERKFQNEETSQKVVD